MGNPQILGQPLRLSSFACARWTHQNYQHDNLLATSHSTTSMEPRCGNRPGPSGALTYDFSNNPE
jgi:hypothetical protein